MEIKEGYTRVSEILGKRSDYSMINPDILANKCRIGTNVHERINLEIQDIFVDSEDDEIGYYESWANWRDANNVKSFNFLKTEWRMYCDKLKITGCVDAIYIDGSKILLIDFKTSASVNKKIWPLQACFYHYLCHENQIRVNDEVIFLHLRKDGEKAFERRYICTPELWKFCENEVNSYRYFYG